jgi:sensor histidine kinase YesM
MIKEVSKTRGAVVVLVIVTVLYPLINLLRGIHYKILSFSRHAKEFLFFFVSLFVLVQVLYFMHRRIAALPLFREKIIGQIITELLLLLLYTPVLSFTVFFLLFPGYLKKGSDLRTTILFTIILILIQTACLFYYHFSDYLSRFRRALLSQEILKYEKIIAQYKAQQNHISPHFIFNCLNNLNAMIDKNPSQASEIVYNLSDCLRHILTMPDKAMVKLDAELSFINKYKKLLDISFPGSIILVNRIAETDKQKSIPPCLLQMMVENAVKHNDFLYKRAGQQNRSFQ